MKKNVLTLSAAIKIMVVLAVLAVLTTVLNVIVNIKKTTLQTDLRKARLLLEKTVNEEYLKKLENEFIEINYDCPILCLDGKYDEENSKAMLEEVMKFVLNKD